LEGALSSKPTSGATDPQVGPDAPAVAFVIACFRARATLADSIASALAQVGVVVEAVVVDDGSDDGSLDLARQLARAEPRLRVVSQTNAGPGAARNRGVRESTAPFLCFLDADDLVPTDKAREDLGVFRRQGAVDVVYTPTATFGDGETTDKPFTIVTNGDELAASLCRGADRGFPIHAATVRRQAFLDVGGFREMRPLVEDLDLWARLAAGDARFMYRDGDPVRYRMTSNSRSTRALEVLAGQLPVLEWLLDSGGEPEHREELAQKLRFRALSLAALLAEHGKTSAARKAALRTLRRARRPGHVLDALRAWRNA
jgi:glycosyltransferase involved in cell wall biosynthesis